MKCGRGRFARKRRKKGVGEERSWERDCESRGERERESKIRREKERTRER